MSQLLNARLKENKDVEILDGKSQKVLNTISLEQAKFITEELNYQNGEEIFDFTILLVSMGVSFHKAYSAALQKVREK